MDKKRTFQSIISLKQKDMVSRLFERDLQLPIDSGHIITVPGVRRCGKSSLMELVVSQLVEHGIDKCRILWIGFDDERLRNITSDDLNDIITGYMEMYPDIEMKDVYMFFDEIQYVDGWELFVLRIFKSYCKNIFVSGSNASLLSAELSTALRGWPIEYEEFPLSFAEYCRFRNVAVEMFSEEGQAYLVRAFQGFLMDGGYPEVVLSANETLKNKLLQSYFNAMLFRDLVDRYGLTNLPAVRYFIKRVMTNLSKPTSINSIYNELKSQGIKVARERLYGLAEQCCSIYLFFRLPKYSKSIVKENSSFPKFYVVDSGLWRSVLTPQSEEKGKLLENAVYLHLRRNMSPSTKLYYYSDKKECDFVVQEYDCVKTLIQVTWSLLEGGTREREIGGLLECAKVTNCNELLIITYNEEENIELSGKTVRVIPAWRWMLA